MAIVWDSQASQTQPSNSSRIQWDSERSTTQLENKSDTQAGAMSPFMRMAAAPFRYVNPGEAVSDPVKFFGHGLPNPIQVTPTEALEPVSSTVGATMGAAVPGHPFVGAGAGGAIGSGIGQSIAALRQADEGKSSPPFSGSTMMKRGAEGVAGVATGKAIGFGAKTARYLVPEQAGQFGEKIVEKFSSLTTQAMQKFGDDLDQLTEKFPDSRVNLRPIIDRLRAYSADPGLRESLRKGMSVYQTAHPRAGQTLGNFLENPEASSTATALEAQHVYNTLKDVNGAEAEALQTRLLQAKSFPKNVPGIRADYYQAMEDIDQLAPILSKQIGLSKRVSVNIGDPGFLDVAKRQLGDQTVKEMAPFGAAQNVREFPGKAASYVGRRLPWIVGLGALGALARKR